jgi:hypothetical protein
MLESPRSHQGDARHIFEQIIELIQLVRRGEEKFLLTKKNTT